MSRVVLPCPLWASQSTGKYVNMFSGPAMFDVNPIPKNIGVDLLGCIPVIGMFVGVQRIIYSMRDLSSVGLLKKVSSQGVHLVRGIVELLNLGAILFVAECIVRLVCFVINMMLQAFLWLFACLGFGIGCICSPCILCFSWNSLFNKVIAIFSFGNEGLIDADVLKANRVAEHNAREMATLQSVIELSKKDF